ncbi:MAG TPA: DUF5715 family protein [Bacteroidales bacterium]|nr:DUF5715 family protein [Bacteroidales bacterium]
MKFHGVYLASVLKIIFALLLIIALIYFIDRFTGNHLSSFFSTRCLDYRQKNYSIKLNDRLVNYSDAAKLRGVKASRNETELKEKISEGKLVRVRSGNKYIIEDMKYSSPYVTKESKALIEEIGRRFREKTSGKG